MKYFIDSSELLQLGPTPRANLRGEFVELYEGTTHFELSGPTGGDIVVLTGGITVPLFYWDGAAAALHDAGFRTLAYSAYGRGYSDRVHGDYDDDLFVRQLTDLINALEIAGRYHLVGASMGALIAMEYTRRRPGAAATLSLIGPAGLSARPVLQRLLTINDVSTGLIARHLGRRILRHHQNRNVADPRLAEKLASMVGDAYRYEGSLYAFFQTLQHFPLFDRAELYRAVGSLDVPTMLMWGTDDLVTPIGSLEDVRELLQPEQLHVVTDCGHMIPFEQPSLVADHIASFINSQKGSTNNDH